MPKLLLKIDLESSEEKFSHKVNGYIKDLLYSFYII